MKRISSIKLQSREWGVCVEPLQKRRAVSLRIPAIRSDSAKRALYVVTYPEELRYHHQKNDDEDNADAMEVLRAVSDPARTRGMEACSPASFAGWDLSG